MYNKHEHVTGKLTGCISSLTGGSLVRISNFHSLLLPEESYTFAENVLDSRSSDFDGNGI